MQSMNESVEFRKAMAGLIRQCLPKRPPWWCKHAARMAIFAIGDHNMDPQEFEEAVVNYAKEVDTIALSFVDQWVD